MDQTRKKPYGTGLLCAVACAAMWGILPLYWQALRPVNSYVIICYRVLFAGVVCFLAALRLYGIKGLREPLREKGFFPKCVLAGVLITANWSIFIWAVNTDHVIQTCIGYYLEPLVVCVFGLIFFRERLTRYKVIAFVLACIGVLTVLLHFMEVPLIALGLALTFAIYSAIKKSIHVPALVSLSYETMLLSPIALAIILYLEISGKGAVGTAQPWQYVLLVLSGCVTILPLGLFAAAASRIPLVTLGITEYISPSLSLLIGIFLLHEPFDRVQFAAFVIIWIGLVFFTIGEYREARPVHKTKTEENEMKKESLIAPGEPVKAGEPKPFFAIFGEGHDRFGFPPGIVRVTAGHGGEATLICGTEKTALLDCGMAYCGLEMVENLKAALAGRPLDYVLLSHSHYDHIGALPYVKRAYPQAVVMGAEHAQKILPRPSARKLMRELGEAAREQYVPGSQREILTDGLAVDRILREGDRILLGGRCTPPEDKAPPDDCRATAEKAAPPTGRWLEVLETKGHTDCCLTYILQPDSIMFSSESTGILETLDCVHTPILKSYEDAAASLKKCRDYGAKRIVLPHLGLLPADFNQRYWQLYEDEVEKKRQFIRGLDEQGLQEPEILQRYLERYWRPQIIQEQPYEAFKLNAGYIVHALLASVKSGNVANQ